jgi:calcineurin-like phosphoesterase family protein
MPFLNPEDKDQRYSQFRPIDKGQWLLHGHVHEKWLHRKRMINVGVDVWNFTPVSEAQITELMADILEAEQA